MHVIIINSNINNIGCRDRVLEVGCGGTMSLLKSWGQTPDTIASCRTGVVHGRSAPRQEWSMGGGHQDRSGPWEGSTKTVVQKADGHIVHFTAFAAGFTITF